MKVASSHAPTLLISFEANFSRYQAEALISKLWVLNPFEEKEPLRQCFPTFFSLRPTFNCKYLVRPTIKTANKNLKFFRVIRR